MPDSLTARLWAGLLGTSPIEALAVLSSLAYVVGALVAAAHIVCFADPAIREDEGERPGA